MVIGLITLLVAAGVGLWVVTRSPVLVSLIEPRLAEQLGADEVTIGSATVAREDLLILSDVTVRAPGQKGTAGDVVHAETLEIDTDLMSLLSGNTGTLTLRLIGARLRLSEDVERSGRYSFMSLRPRASQDDGPSRDVTIELRNSVVEVGSHRGGRYTKSGELPVAGNFRVLKEDPDWLFFLLNEADARGRATGEEGLRVEGRLNLRTFANEGRVTGLTFDERIELLCPSVVRAWWETLELEGSVQAVNMAFDPDAGPSAEIAVQDVGLTIPFLSENVWGLYVNGKSRAARGLPRMRVDRGVIRLVGNEIHLINLQGNLASTHLGERLVSVPYLVNGKIGPVAPFNWDRRGEWVEELVAGAPLNLDFLLDDFLFEGADGVRKPAVELPVVITKIFEQFQIESCALDTLINVQRGENDGGGPRITSSGTATLTAGKGRYSKFPYPLHNVSATLEFTQDHLNILSLLGEGVTGGRVAISGSVWPIDMWPNVDLHVSGEGLPLTKTLRDAFPEEFQRVYDTILHEESLAELRAQEVVPDQDDADAAAARALALARERVAVEQEQRDGLIDDQVAAAQLEGIERRIGALERTASAPPFEMGGLVEFELDVQRDAGQGNRTRTLGTIVVNKAGLVLRHFPYPIHIEGGTIELEPHGARVADMYGVAPGGGSILINGVVDTTKNEESDTRRIAPQLQIGIIDDMINPALIAAIPLAGRAGAFGVVELPAPAPDEDSALDVAAELLEAAGLEGLLSWEGTVSVDSESKPTWDIAVILSDGNATPDESMTEVMQSIGLFWPSGFTLSDVSGSMRITPDAIEIGRFTGRHGEGSITINESFARLADKAESRFQFAFTNFALEEYLLNLFPQQGIGGARTFWERYQPQGTFDAELTYHRVGDVVAPLELKVTPNRVLLTVDEQPVYVERGGDHPALITLRAGSVTFDDLGLQLHSAFGYDGRVNLSGRFGAEEEGAQTGPRLSLHGDLVDIRLDSPWITEALSYLASPGEIEQFRALQATGALDGAFVYEQGEDGGPAYAQLTIDPNDLRMTINGVHLSLRTDSETIVSFDKGSVFVDGARGAFASGGRFHVSARVTTGEEFAASVSIGYRGDGLGPELKAFLPGEVLTAFDSIELAVDESVEITGGNLRLERISEGADARWRRMFDGDVAFTKARFNAGLDYSEIDGGLSIHFESESGGTPRLEMTAHAERAIASRRELTDLTATFDLTDDGRSLVLRELRADCYGGVITATATSDFRTNGRYDAMIELIGIRLSDFSNPAWSEDSSGADSTTEGVLYGRIALDGTHGMPELLRGRGEMRIMRGRLANNPITLPLLELSQLMLPIDASLEYAEASLFIRGRHAVFERIIFESDRILLSGDGSMSLDGYELDVRLRSRGRLIGISDLVAALNDQLYAIHVTGPLDDTTAKIVPLPALSGFYGDEWVDRRIRRRTLVTEDEQAAAPDR